jgi:hypothetical protein
MSGCGKPARCGHNFPKPVIRWKSFGNCEKDVRVDTSGKEAYEGSNMPRAAKRADNEEYIEVGYEDKVVFTPRKKARGRLDVIATWQRSQGLWSDHPVFCDMAIREIIEWLRGEDCDV